MGIIITLHSGFQSGGAKSKPLLKIEADIIQRYENMLQTVRSSIREVETRELSEIQASLRFDQLDRLINEGLRKVGALHSKLKEGYGSDIATANKATARINKKYKEVEQEVQAFANAVNAAKARGAARKAELQQGWHRAQLAKALPQGWHRAP